MSSKKTVLIICDANLPRAPRVKAAYLALSDEFNFIMAGYLKPDYPDVRFIELPRKKKRAKTSVDWHMNWPTIFRKPISAFLKIYLRLKNGKPDNRTIKERYEHLFEGIQPDLIINHHLNSLELGVSLKNKWNIPLISNLHEYYPREFEDQEVWLQYEAPKKIKICQDFLPQADQVFSVCEGIRQEYFSQFGVDSVVIRNDKPFHPTTPVIHDSGPIRLIHHGAALKSRNLHLLIEAVKPLKNHILDLMLLPTQQDYYESLQTLCKDVDHINIIPPVDPKNIIPFISSYDVGVFLLEPVNFNYKMALPNKLFEFVQGRLAIAITPNQEMARIVNDYDLGVVAEDYSVEAFTKILANLDREKVAHFKKQADTHARTLSSESTHALIRENVHKLLE